MAHYGLGESGQFVGDTSDALADAIKGLCGMSRSDLLEISGNQLLKISEWNGRKFSKTQLKGIRALLGDHT